MFNVPVREMGAIESRVFRLVLPPGRTGQGQGLYIAMFHLSMRRRAACMRFCLIQKFASYIVALMPTLRVTDAHPAYDRCCTLSAVHPLPLMPTLRFTDAHPAYDRCCTLSAVHPLPLMPTLRLQMPTLRVTDAAWQCSAFIAQRPEFAVITPLRLCY